MKKIFGVLCLVIGLFLIALGLFGMGTTNGERKSHYSQIEMTPTHKTYKETEMVMGGAIATVGLLFHIIGVVLLVTKTKKQYLLEAELEVLKNNKTV
jgi:hypothetical protein